MPRDLVGRFLSAIIDANTTLIGDVFENLPETYVIFITRSDYLGKGAPFTSCHWRLCSGNRA